MASEQQKTPAQIALEAFNAAVAGQQAELDAREAAVKKEREELEEEKQRMAKVDAKESDVILLNVGGRPFATTRKTLCIEPDTMLANMFSGRWEDRLVRVGPANDHVFFNFNPDLFAILLDYLRSKEIAPPGTKVSLPSSSQLPAVQQQTYKLMLEYLGFRVSNPALGFTFAEGTANFTVSNEGKMAVYTGGGGPHILTKQVCEPGVSVWRVKATAGTYIMLGVVRQNTTVTANVYSDGYMFYNYSQTAYAKGAGVNLTTGAPFSVGHTVALSLSTGGVLSLRNETTGVTHTLPTTVQMTDTYKFVYHANSGASSVEILD